MNRSRSRRGLKMSMSRGSMKRRRDLKSRRLSIVSIVMGISTSKGMMRRRGLIRRDLERRRDSGTTLSGRSGSSTNKGTKRAEIRRGRRDERRGRIRRTMLSPLTQILNQPINII